MVDIRNIFNKFILSVVLLCLYFVNCQIPGKPLIILTQQISTNSIKLQWAVQTNIYKSLTRYRVQLSRDNFQNDIKDWPAQITKVNYDTTDPWFKTSIKNNFDCFNECIQTFTCVYALRLYDGNCYLKSTNQNRTVYVRTNTEYIIITNYTNQIILENIPFNEVYKFRVAVYGVNFTGWSEFSEPSNEIDMRVRINITSKQTGFSSAKINWMQYGNFTNYPISKYKLKLRYNYSPDKEFIPDPIYYSTFELQPNYDDARFLINYRPVLKDVCISACQDNKNCTSVSYLPNTQECFLKDKRDILNGFIRDQGYDIYALKSLANEINVTTQLFPNTEFRFNLEYITPYGSIGSSNELIYKQNESIPILNIYVYLDDLSVNLTWSINGDFPLKRFSIGTAKDNSSAYDYVIEYSDSDFGDPSQTIVPAKDLNACYEACYFNTTCISYVWSNFSSICILKFQRVNPTNCANETICATIPDYKNSVKIVNHLVNVPYCYRLSIQDQYGINTKQSKTNCFEFQFKVETKSLSPLVNGYASNVECVYTPVNDTRIKSFNWYKDGLPVDLNKLNAELTLRGKYLYFRSVSNIIHSGKYQCDIELVTGQLIKSPNPISLLISYDYTIAVESEPVVRINYLDSISIPCIVDGYPLPKIFWKYNLLGIQYVTIKNITEVSFPTNRTLYLTLTKIEAKNNGSYICTSEDGKKFDKVDIVVQSKPSQPKILNAYSNGTITYINWIVEDFGQLNLTLLRIEWSKNFNISGNYNYTVVDFVNIQNNEVKLGIVPVNYTIRIAVYNSLGESPYSDFKMVNCLYCNTITPNINISVIPDDSQPRASPEPPYIIIFSVVGAVLVVIVIIILVVILLTKKKSRKSEKNNSKLDTLNNFKDSLIYDTFDPTTVKNPYDPADKFYTSTESPEKSNYHYKQYENTYTIESLYETWISKLHVIDKELANEFATITNPINLTTNEAKRICNYEKSKYKSIYPYDINRVELSMKNGIEGSDFINASFVEGLFENRKFIAAQAPTNQTIHDFLRMIYEFNIKKIVMLTNFYEEEPLKLKCVPYWDDRMNVKFGELCIKVTNYENNLTYIKRKFMITSMNNPDYAQFVDHYQYIEWPDKSVPTETQSLVSLINRVNEEHLNDKSPILVHCSAGVGRTGTYIAIDFLLEMILANNKINIFELVNYLRHQRVYLVQTWEQYKFIHLAILEYYLFGTTFLTKQSCKLQLQILLRRDENSNQSLLDMQYRNVASFKDKIRTTHVYSAYRNKFNSSIFKPYDSSLVKLSVINQDASTMYIDAVQFKISETYENYIIASDPNYENIYDFIRMIFMTRVSLIVSLSSQFYLPEENETIELKDVIIFNKKKNFENGTFVYLLEFINTKTNDNHTVYYIEHTSNWSIGQTLPQNRLQYINFIKEILFLIDPDNSRLAGLQQPVILVHSNDGGDRCAVCVASCHLMKSLSITGQFDVVQVALILRKCRTNMINTFEYYKFLYEICCEFVEVTDLHTSIDDRPFYDNYSDLYE